MEKIKLRKVFYRYLCRECGAPVHTESPVIVCPFCHNETDVFYQGMYVNGKWVPWEDYRDQGVLRLIHSLEQADSCMPEKETLPKAA
ncbi:hypothetical protein ACFL5V_07125 [Fibrobacterota bacterium]